METAQRHDMDFIKLTDYVQYALNPLISNKITILVTTVTVGTIAAIADIVNSAVNWISLVLVIHSMFIIMYTGLSLMDWITGLIAGVIVEKNKFSSGKFFKKPFLIMFCLFMLYDLMEHQVEAFYQIIYLTEQIGKN